MTRSLITLQAHVSAINEGHAERGATMVEYGMLLAFIAMVALVGVKTLGTTLTAAFTGFAGAL